MAERKNRSEAYPADVAGAGANHESAAATKDHVTRLVAKQAALAVATTEALGQLMAAVGRGVWTPSEAVEWWQWARSLSIVGASTTMAEALRVPVNNLSHWSRFGPPGSATKFSGRLGEWNWTGCPPKGTPAVYLLIDGNDRITYIGSSRQTSARLRAHEKDPVKRAFGWVRWEAITQPSLQEALQLEADLIYQHQPILNVAGRSRRLHVV